MAAKPKIRIAGDLATSIKVTRGLRQLTEAVPWIPWKLHAAIAALASYVPVRGGEETLLTFGAARIPRHAEIGKVTAKLELGPSPVASPPKMEQGAQVREGETTRTFTTALDPPAGPSSLTLGIEGGAVIWTWSGRPGPTSFDIPDFSDQANAFLERAAAQDRPGSDGLVSLRLTLRSDLDTGVRLTLPDDGLEYRLVQPQGWDNDLDGTLHMDRNLTLGFGQMVDVPLDPIVTGDDDHSVPVEEVRLEVGGDLGPERLLGQVVSAATKEYATVGSGFAVAQALSLPAGLPSAECVGVALALAPAEGTEIYFEVQPDAGGTPASGPPLASGTITVPAEKAAGRSRWVTGRFTEPAKLTAEAAPFWLVLKEIRGICRIALGGDPTREPSRTGARDGAAAPGSLGVLMNRGGQFWQALDRRGAGTAPGTRALVRLAYLPEADTRSAAVELRAELIGAQGATGEAVNAKVDPTPEAQLVRLPFLAGARARRIRLTVLSHAEGGLSLANLVQVYRPA